MRNKKKIINDPVYGFISIPDEIIFDIIEHRYFQRLRRIKQLGLTHLVYPGALHTRFHHSIGTMHLMMHAINVLQSNGHQISKEETQAVLIAILLHDIGHGPYSHTLEKSIVCEMDHEDLSLLFMHRLNMEFNGKLSLAINIFQNKYHKKFLHQLVSSQLDMDRLDYLKRDSFFTGVSEGVINSDRIIKMLDVVNDQLVVEAKGIYSIEKFIIARRLMYWQVYMHKTVLSAENMLIRIIKRAKELSVSGFKLFTTEPLGKFLQNNYCKNDFLKNDETLELFSRIDDYDIFTSIKEWANSDDKTLKLLCSKMVNRQLFRTEMQNKPFDDKIIYRLRKKVQEDYQIDYEETKYFVFSEVAKNSAYNPANDKINILYRNGDIMDITEASDQLNVSVLSKIVTKYFLCYPKNFRV